MKRFTFAALLLIGFMLPAWAENAVGLSAYEREDFATAFREFKKAAEQGDADAQFYLGQMYRFGQGIPHNYSKAVKWYRRASKQGHLDARYKLGIMYYSGQGIQQDYSEVLKPIPQRYEPGDVFKDCDLCPEMVVITPGSFRMGDLNGSGDSDEKPVHTVTIARPFAAGVYEVTFDEWDACVVSRGCARYRPESEGWGRKRHPVINVSWEDAKGYLGWLSHRTGKIYRLLSEAEWEYVARAGSSARYPWGINISSSLTKFTSGRGPVMVGLHASNGFGVHDTIGNVWEWVEDCWRGSYSGVPTNGSAWTVGGDCHKRVLRGGSWYYGPRVARSASRAWDVTNARNYVVGFRVARTLD